MNFEKYVRQISISGWGIEGQERLANSVVAVVGAGGLGSFVIPQLLSLGVGKVKVFEFEKIELSNLNRQILYSEKFTGMSKAEIIKNRWAEFNNDVRLIVEEVKIESEKDIRFFKDVDLIIDAVDNVYTRLLLGKFVESLKIPLIHGAVSGFYGQVGVFFSQKPLRMIYGGRISHQSPPVYVAICGLIGSLQVNEAVKLLLWNKTDLINKLLVVNLKTLSFKEVEIGGRI